MLHSAENDRQEDNLSYPPRVRRALRGQPRTETQFRRQPPRRSNAQVGHGTADAASEDAHSAARTLIEWHDMTPGEQCTAWAQLRAWVTWLTDRYELTSEDRLPVCWAQHPGLVEELWALRAWRLEIYGGRQPASAQAARYWHTELRQVLYAATTMYASGCRAGHRSAPRVVFGDAEVHRRWAEANFLAGVPAVDVAAGRAKRGSGWIPAEQMAAAIDVEEAAALPGMDDYVTFAGSWWIPASDGWIEVPALPVPVRDAGTDPWALDGVQEDGDPWRR